MATPPPNTPLGALRPLAGRALEAALNRALALDPATRDALAPLAGRSVALRLDAPALALRLTIADGRIAVGPADAAGEPDLSVRSTLGGLLAQLPGMLGGAERGAAAPVGRVRIEGDAELARQLQRLAQRFDPDWERPFASAFGDVAGVQIARAIAAALRGARATGDSLARSAAEYLTEESRDAVGREELHAFLDDVDALRDDVERVAARVRRLQGAAGGAAAERPA
ncbi:SCP2 sterol-binding domain-containing protein [Luteimonas sp. RD2P54]|uniref:Ubiquinone biosynthesis accessory factor UbiJ n=1 Tax=Luteimonas endophytica TaxID=3042023 RepID=A0ABT6J7C2_9GAMM|nr:SCP2 sterol-binding domain-containing protein [Luteimonas endophytica]MDH5822472.1 SCP2 sterol-binding domain-containing protein [Luteimonas endophytica]